MDRGAHAFANFSSPVSDIVIVALTILEIPIAGLLNLTGLIHEASPRAKFFDALINCHRRGNGAEEHVLHERGRINSRWCFLGTANSSHARSKKETVAFLAPVETVDAETIDGKDEADVFSTQSAKEKTPSINSTKETPRSR